MSEFLHDIDISTPDFADLNDELPLWSASFSLLLLSQVPLRRGMKILDIGAGTGFLTVELAQRCGHDCRVVAVDPWGTALQRLRRKVAHIGLRNVEFIEQDAATADLGDNDVDLIVSNLGINNMSDPGRVLRNCFGAARPGASIVLTSNSVGHMQEFYDVFQSTLLELGLTRRLTDLQTHIEPSLHAAATGTVARGGRLPRAGYGGGPIQAALRRR